MTITLPYIASYGNVEKCLNKIIEAETPPTFSQDHLAKTFKMTGGGAMPVIKLLKRLGFLSENGAPTQIYRDFRINSTRGAAAAKALKIGYAELFKQNEYIYKETDEKLKEAIISTLQCDNTDSRIAKILRCFNIIKAFANFEQVSDETVMQTENHPLSRFNDNDQEENLRAPTKDQNIGLNLAYVVNLNLPESPNPEVFNAIFKSLKDNLLKND